MTTTATLRMYPPALDPTAPRPARWAPVTAVLVVIALFTWWSIAHEFDMQRARAGARLGAMGELRAAQVEAWVDRQMSLAGFLSSGRNLADLLDRTLDLQDEPSRLRLLGRAVSFRRANDADSALVVDAEGRQLAGEAETAGEPVPPALQAAVRRAVELGVPVHTEIYSQPGSAMAQRLDVVAPLLREAGPARGAVVIRVDPRRSLYPVLAAWPLTPSGDTVLWRRSGDEVVSLNDRRLGTAGPVAQALPSSQLAAARLLRGELAPGESVVAPDGRGVPALAAGRPVKGTDWWVVSTIDLAEVDAPAYAVMYWTLAAAAFAAVGLIVAGHTWSQRQVLSRVAQARTSERERLRTLRLLEAITHSASDAIFAKDLDGRYVFYNRAAAQAIGKSQQAVIGRNDIELFGEPVAAELTASDRQALAAGRPVEFEEAIPGAAGVAMVLCTKGPLFDDDGRLIGLFGVSHDITEARRVKEELAAHRDRLEEMVLERTAELRVANESLASAVRFNRALTDAIPGRVAYWDAEFRCRFANRNYAEWFGKTPEEMLGVAGKDLLDADAYASLLPHIEGALAGNSQRFERERAGPDGIRAVHEIHWVPERTPDGRVPGAYVMAFDITAIKMAQAELSAAKDVIERSRDQAEAANRAKSAFLANMSHEIRTPMNAIIGLTHLMARDTRDSLQRERLGSVASAAQHLLQVINDVLDISKIEAGKMALVVNEFAVEPLLARSLQMVADRARDKGLALLLDAHGLPARLRGDATRISQALINLLTNAVKFTEHGSVRLHVGIARQDAHAALVRFEVQDTGPGIAGEHQAHLFKAFEQADTTATRTHGGTGLGLALTRQLAALMGGEAGVRSFPGSGSTFWFTAELASASEAGEQAVPIPSEALRALLVDGFVESSTAFAQRLRALGVQLHIEPDATAAQAWVEAEFALGRVADLVFIDSRTGAPGADDTIARLRAALGAGMPPSILLAHPGSAGGNLCDAEIAMPVGASALHDTIQRVVRRQGDWLGAAAPPGEAEALVKLRHAGQRVLLAEDNPVNRDVASELIRSAGLLIETAPDGAQAVELALSRRYDLILMDIQMPVMDGLQATRLIRAKAGRGVPVIALTANAFVDDRAACIDAGMNDHVCKPVDPEVLYATLLRWLPLVERNLAQAPAAGKRALPGAPALRSLRERLGGVEGFVVTTALRNVGGKMETVARVLARFSDSYRAGVPEFEDVGADSDRQAIRQACHSLRGACAAIGAKFIETELQVFEDALGHDGNAASWGEAATTLNQHVTRLVGALELELQR